MQTLFDGKKILIAPLNWGLGHATRSIPVIQRLLELGAEVHLAGDGAPLQFLSEAFPELTVHQLPAYNIEYPAGLGGAWKTVFSAPKIIQAIKDEQKAVERLVSDLRLDIIISDHRYGVYSPAIPSVFIGHQLRVLPPKGLRWGSGAILSWHRTYLKRFTEIWVPDFPGEDNLSGILSHGVDTGIPVKFIGPQSRFATLASERNLSEEKIVAVLSGPEPQRTFIENKLIQQLKSLGEPALLIRGVVKDGGSVEDGNLHIVNYLHGEALFRELQNAKYIICRPGYSTLMDLVHVGKKVILIPTPGQTEQEYLAENLARKSLAVVQKQSSLQLSVAIEQLTNIRQLPNIVIEENLLENQLKELSNKLTPISEQ